GRKTDDNNSGDNRLLQFTEPRRLTPNAPGQNKHRDTTVNNKDIRIQYVPEMTEFNSIESGCVNVDTHHNTTCHHHMSSHQCYRGCEHQPRPQLVSHLRDTVHSKPINKDER